MIFKAINDIRKLDDLIPTLLIFSAYPCIVTNLSILFL